MKYNGKMGDGMKKKRPDRSNKDQRGERTQGIKQDAK
jgi:hypothetical protein